jgi:hydroxyethylthiazole kinase
MQLSVLRGNAGEVLTLVGAGGKVRGVDSMEDMGERDEAVAAFAQDRGFTVAVTGEVDLVCDGQKKLRVKNGHPLLSRVTGTGCSATTVIAAFVAAAKDRPLEATACALAAFGLAAEQAAGKAAGPGTFVAHLLDALAALDEKAVLDGVKIEESA